MRHDKIVDSLVNLTGCYPRPYHSPGQSTGCRGKFTGLTHCVNFAFIFYRNHELFTQDFHDRAGRLFDCLIAVDQLQLAKLLVEFLQRFRLLMVNREAIADCLRRIILSDGQGAAAAIADAFRLGRIGDDVIAGAAVRADTAAVIRFSITSSAISMEMTWSK